MRLLSSYSAKASYAQLPDMPLPRDTQALRLIASIPLILRRESAILMKKKEPSRSGILLSTHVAQTYLPLVHNFYPYAEQQPNIGLLTNQ